MSVTEALDPRSLGLDARGDAEVLAVLLQGQISALGVVAQAFDGIAKGAALMAGALRGQGRLVYAGAGSSALMGNADGMELAGTFGIDPGRVVLRMAGGLPPDATLPGGVEDDVAQAERDAIGLGPGDVVIAITASGRTPYAVRMAQLARAAGAETICIANVQGAAIFAHATVAICLRTPPELVAGSTRMGAGTAQKAALNLMSTLMAMRLGHVHDGMMVNLRADNDKLRARAIGIVSKVAGVTEDRAEQALAQTEGRVKPAILLAIGALTPDDAQGRLNETRGNLRAALKTLGRDAMIGTENKTSMEKPI